MPAEFDIITRHFCQAGLAADPARQRRVALGIGDDCALIKVPRGQQLALSMDVLVEGLHFPAGAPSELVAWRALAVNLSDLAAMGAEPHCFTLGLTLPGADEVWLEAFARGLRDSAQLHGCPLVGGNLARGPLQIAIQVQGLVPPGKALLRSGARAGHDVYVSGEPGRAGLALELLLGRLDGLEAEQEQELLDAYYKPQPRLALGQGLRGLASAAQDVSDGLLIDLSRLAAASKVRIEVDIAAMPLAGVLTRNRDSSEVFRLAMTAGDDYELVFTAAPGRRRAVEQAAARAGVRISRIGRVLKGEGVEVRDLSGRALAFDVSGFDHFR
jgi:thiamine-monophosphate kinase